MENSSQSLPAGEALSFESLLAPAEQGIATRVLARSGGGTLTLFAFDAGQKLNEHTTPFEVLVLTLNGRLEVTIAGKTVVATPDSLVRLPANVPHAVRAPEPARMLLLVLRDVQAK